MTKDEFETIKVGDRLRREGLNESDDDRVFTGVVSGLNPHTLRVETLVKGVRAMPLVGRHWHFQIENCDLYHFIEYVTVDLEFVEDVPGLKEEKIDWDAHRAFLREHCK